MQKQEIKKKKNSSHLISELTNGPVSVSDTVRGKIIFSLTDTTPVRMAEPENQWCKINVKIDLTSVQLKDQMIKKGDKLLYNGEEFGYALDDIELNSASETNDVSGRLIERTGRIVGYIPYSNIRQNTIPENVLAETVDRNTELSFDNFAKLVADFHFSDHGFVNNIQEFQFNNNWQVDFTFARIILLFENKKLIAIVHSRKINLKGFKSLKLKAAYTLSYPAYTRRSAIDSLTRDFNSSSYRYITNQPLKAE